MAPSSKRQKALTAALGLVLAAVGVASVYHYDAYPGDTTALVQDLKAQESSQLLKLKTDGKSKGASPSTKVSDVASKVSSAASHVASGVSSAASDVQSGVSSFASDVSSLGSSIASGASSLASSIESGVSSAASDASSLASSITSSKSSSNSGSSSASSASSDSSSDSSSSVSVSRSSSSSSSSSSSGSAEYDAGVELQTQISGELADTVKRLEGQVEKNRKAIGVETVDGDDTTTMTEIKELQRAVTALEARVLAQEDDDAHLKSVSEFEINGEKAPVRNYLLPGKVIEFRGRTTYSLTFKIRQNSVTPHWSNIVHVGDTNTIRSPGIWQFPTHSRRLHFRQGGENRPAASWNYGCDPTTADTPPLHVWFDVKVTADKEAYTVFYNNVQKCRSVFDVNPPAGQQSVYFSDPWHIAAPVTIKDMKFAII